MPVTGEELAEGLRRARDLLATPETWSRYALYRVRPSGVAAWCIGGALNEACPKFRGSAHAALRKAIGLGKHDDVAVWNDERGRTHAEVLAAFDRAIEEATE